MANLIVETVGGEPYQYYPLGRYVVRAPGVCGGRPTFKYTRIEITGALDRLAIGEHINDVVTGYRGRVSKMQLWKQSSSSDTPTRTSISTPSPTKRSGVYRGFDI